MWFWSFRMSECIDLVELRKNVLERIMEKSGILAGDDMTDFKISVWDAKIILYEEVDNIFEEVGKRLAGNKLK